MFNGPQTTEDFANFFRMFYQVFVSDVHIIVIDIICVNSFAKPQICRSSTSTVCFSLQLIKVSLTSICHVICQCKCSFEYLLPG